MRLLNYFFLFFFIASGLSAKEDFIIFLNEELDLLEQIKLYYNNQHPDISFEPYLSLKPKQYTYNELILHINCEAENPNFIKDLAGKFKFIKRDVFLIQENHRTFCYYKNRNNTLILESNPEYWPVKNNDEFSIFIKFKPFVSLKDQILFDWSSYTQEEIKSFRISLYKNYIQVQIYNILKIDNDYKNFILDIEDVHFNQWNDFFLTLSNDNKILKIYLNNELKKMIHLSQKTILDFHSIHIPPIRIGYKFLGFLEEILILNKYYQEPPNTRKFEQIKVLNHSGRINQSIKTIVTPIIQIPENTHKMELAWHIDHPEGSILKLYYKATNSLYDFKNISWKEISLNSKSYIFDPNILNPYFQFRIDMLHDSDGKETPSIYSLVLKKETMKRPPAISGLRIIKELSNENQVCLEWQKLPEEEIEEHGGYKIHIGIHPEASEIVLDKILLDNQWIRINKKHLNFPQTKEEESLERLRPEYWNRYKNTHIRILLTKEMLEHYATYRFEKNDLAINRIKLLFEKNIIYYFRVSSYLYNTQNTSPLSLAVSYSF